VTQAFVLDCWVALGFLLPDEQSAYSLAVLDSCASIQQLYVPVHFHTELLNGLLQAQKKQRCSATFASLYLEQILDLPVVQCPLGTLGDLLFVDNLAKRYDLTAYDASYLAVALKQNAHLATGDKALRRAAVAENLFFNPLQ